MAPEARRPNRCLKVLPEGSANSALFSLGAEKYSERVTRALMQDDTFYR
jgi:hypothetical protein